MVKDALLSSYEMACETTALEGSRLIIEEISGGDFLLQVPSAASRSLHSVFLLRGVRDAERRGNHGKELEVFALEIRE